MPVGARVVPCPGVVARARPTRARRDGLFVSQHSPTAQLEAPAPASPGGASGPGGDCGAIGLVSVPVVAQAQPPAPPPPTGAAACNLVSQADVSYVVGWTVPAPQVGSSTQIFDKKDNISGTFTECTYWFAYLRRSKA